MNAFWRTCMVLFALVALVSVGMLAVLWLAWPPLMPAANMISGQSWFRMAEMILLGITITGLVAMIVVALALPRRRSRLTVERDNGGVNISQAALQSTIERTVAAHRGLTAKKATAKIVGRKNPAMEIRVDVDPGGATDLGELGVSLQYEIARAVEHFASCPVKIVHLTFTEPARTASAPQYATVQATQA